MSSGLLLRQLLPHRRTLRVPHGYGQVSTGMPRILRNDCWKEGATHCWRCRADEHRISDMDVPNFPVAEFAPESERQEACCVTRCNSLPDETCTGEQRLTQEWDAICTDPADCAASCCERPCSDLQFTCPIGATPIPSEWEPEAVPSNADQRCCMYTCDANTQCPDAGTVADPYRDCNWDGHNPDECHDPGDQPQG